jgi:hypothetical protein
MVKNRRRRSRISRMLEITNHDIEVVRSFKYLGTVGSNTNDEQKKSKLQSQPLKKSIPPCTLHVDVKNP